MHKWERKLTRWLLQASRCCSSDAFGDGGVECFAPTHGKCAVPPGFAVLDTAALAARAGGHAFDEFYRTFNENMPEDNTIFKRSIPGTPRNFRRLVTVPARVQNSSFFDTR